MLRTCLFKNETVTFYDKGKGKAVVLLHGFLGSHKIWEQTIENLSTSYRVIAIDLPGHGGTANFGYAHSMDLMAKCVKAVMDHLRLKKYVLVGHSMGGYVALAFADLFPDHVRGLCLYHSTAFADSEEKKKDRLRAINAVKSNRGIYTKNTIRNLFATKNLKYLKHEISFATGIARQTSRRGIIAALHGMKDRFRRDIILGLVDYPIMMVIGEHDNVLPYEQLLEQSETIRNKTVLYLEHDGHFGFLESPRESNRALRKFLRKCR
jgi:pimeloyl-ACP methyl ester carboxylesterase